MPKPRTFKPGDLEPEDHPRLQDDRGRVWVWESEAGHDGWWPYDDIDLDIELMPFPFIFLTPDIEGRLPTKLTALTSSEFRAFVEDFWSHEDAS